MTTLYNRYISEQNPYIPVDGERTFSGRGAEGEGTYGGHGAEGKGTPPAEKRPTGLFRGALGNLSLEGVDFSSILRRLHLEDLDSGDILLGLIILFLILEDGDNLDLIITLGLMILFSLGDP